MINPFVLRRPSDVPERSPSMEKPSRALQTLNIASAVLILIAIGLVFFYAPEELVMGQVQRIFYFHVASAWVGFLAFFVTVVAGVLYLRPGPPQLEPPGRAPGGN